MFEILVRRKKAEKHPFQMFFIGIVYASLAIPVSLLIFKPYASLAMVFFTVLSSVHVVQGVLSLEEKKERFAESEPWLLKEHRKALLFFLFLFLGFVVAFSFWSFILPTDVVAQLFQSQENSINRIQSITGNAISGESLKKILFNNIKVMLLSILLALFYGAGSIFILAWNASVMGLAIGNFAKTTAGLLGIPLALTKYLVHGLPEIAAYFIAALAGGIIGIAIIKKDFSKERIKTIGIDIIMLLFIAIILLITAAFIEVYISPKL